MRYGLSLILGGGWGRIISCWGVYFWRLNSLLVYNIRVYKIGNVCRLAVQFHISF